MSVLIPTWRAWFETALAEYESPAAYYEEYRRYHEPIYDAVVRAHPPPALLMELGAGIGFSARALSERGYQVIAWERDQAMIRFAAALEGLPSMPSMYHGDEGDALVISRHGGSLVSVVTCLGVVEHYEPSDRARLLRTLVAIAPVVVVSIPSPLLLAIHPPTMGEQEITLDHLAGECQAAGMHIVEQFGWGSVPDREGQLSFCVVGRR